MKLASQEFVDDIQAVIDKHKLDNIRVADTLGQALERIIKCHIGNSIPWHLGGLLFSYAHRHDAVGHLVRLVERIEAKLGTDPLNYNDTDCDMWARKIVHHNECLDCDSLLAKMEFKASGKTIDGVCARCNGTKIDPEYTDTGWFLVWDNHGNGLAYIVWENCLNWHLDIRELPYNQDRKIRVKTLNKLVSEYPRGKYEMDCPLIRYLDGRDEGFVLTLELDKPDKTSERGPNHECEGTLHADYALTSMVEHFSAVLKEELEESRSSI